jgi:hypothetical protein
MFDGTTGADHQRLTNPPPGRLQRLGDHLFRAGDARARGYGWEVTSRRRGLSRSYRDPRFDLLASHRYGTGPGGRGEPVQPGPGEVAAGHLVDDWPGRPPHPDPVPVSTSDGPGYRPMTVSPMERAVVPLARPNPAILGWRWRYELGVLAALAVGLALAVPRYGPLWTVLALAGLVAGVGAVPAVRRFAVRRAWCVITPHRVRTGCAHAWIQSRTGKVPAVLWTSAVPVGERVLLWCRPGTTAEDLAAARDLLATACWAQDVEVQRHPRRSQLAALVVVRHPTGRPARQPGHPGRPRRSGRRRV